MPHRALSLIENLPDQSILQRIGNTPLIRIRLLEKEFPHITFYAKAEWFNPGGSVKDRPALRMIEEAERTGELTVERVILDSTSGNTGIAYALIGAAKGYQVKLVMPANVNEERREIVKAFGAEAIFTSALEGSDGAIREAHRMKDAAPGVYFMPDQYNNPFNWRSHFDTTGPEILDQTHGEVTHVVAGLGTTGTLMGVGRFLKRHNRGIRVIAAEPSDGLHGLEGLKHMGSSIVPGIYDPSVQDEKISVPTEAAYELAHDLARSEGLLVGNSSGAALYAAREVARRTSDGVFVMIFPDGGDRYFCSGLYRRKFCRFEFRLRSWTACGNTSKGAIRTRPAAHCWVGTRAAITTWSNSAGCEIRLRTDPATAMLWIPSSNCGCRRMPKPGDSRSSASPTATPTIRRSRPASIRIMPGAFTATWWRRCRRAGSARPAHGDWAMASALRRSRSLSADEAHQAAPLPSTTVAGRRAPGRLVR